MVMAVKDHTKAKDGFELQFGANHLGYFLLTNLLVPKIIAAHRRFINVTSFGYMSGGVIFDDLSFKNGATYNPWLAYAEVEDGQYPLYAIVCIKVEIKAPTTPKLLAASDATTIYGVFSPDLNDESGAFLVDAQIFLEPLLPHATGDSDAERLWEISEKVVDEKFTL
ncbi:MAG: hypothetical protein GOMPHAMPRED_001511 [Gomphillus americanus]|uniref:Uncharacterized protein n=1 Tax=Gomphillus americanus TaxID=1940652 RepID=A0A8H3F7E6_9LECA|nr:MAG: hypothetical protein GOMPHAMPRED_001511 [Gomphillus americanus]